MGRLTPGRWAATVGVFLVLVCIAAAVSLFMGPAWLPPGRTWQVILAVLQKYGGEMLDLAMPGSWKPGFARGAAEFLASPPNDAIVGIVLVERLPRILLALLTGGALATAGVVFQAILRNPLASPYILGVSSGGALGAVLAIRFGLDFAVWGVSPVTLFAFLGSLVSVGLVYSIARTHRSLPGHTLILAGVIVNAFFSSITMFVNYSADFTQSRRIVTWLMGGLYGAEYGMIARAAPWMLIGFSVLLMQCRAMNLMSFGEESASQLGVNVELTKLVSFVGASLVTGVAVSVSGPIGFVGLIIPHLVRLIIGPDHRLLLPSSALAGALFLGACDTAARTAFGPTEVPVGVITAMCGAPFFIWLLKTRQHKAFVA